MVENDINFCENNDQGGDFPYGRGSSLTLAKVFELRRIGGLRCDYHYSSPEHNEKFGDDCSSSDAFQDERVLGLAVYRKSVSGLPVNLYLDDCGDWLKNRHIKRILFQGNYNDDIDISILVPMSIAYYPEILTEDNSLYAEIAECDIKVISYFVEDNQHLLERLCLPDNGYNIQDFCKAKGKGNFDELREDCKKFLTVRPQWKWFFNFPCPYYLSSNDYWCPWDNMPDKRKNRRRQKLRNDLIHRENEAKLRADGKKLRPSKRFNKKYWLYLLTRGAKNSIIPASSDEAPDRRSGWKLKRDNMGL